MRQSLRPSLSRRRSNACGEPPAHDRKSGRASHVKVVIVGGGVMGCAAALALADRGADVVLLERAVPGAEASSAAAGILGAQMEAHANAPLVRTFTKARAEYTQWAEALRARTGIDIGHRVSGGMRVATSDAEEADLAKDVAWQRAEGLRAELVDAKEARAI